MIDEEYPWLHHAWHELKIAYQAGRVAQALLIAGTQGLGKMQLAEQFAKWLLCQKDGEGACGFCQSCELFEAKTHPDYHLLIPAEPGKMITIDKVRDLIATLYLKPQYSGYRVVIIAPAQQMNAYAANSLLKTLEEPDEHTVFLLLTETPSAMPTTILSRCQKLYIAEPEHDQAIAWLSDKGFAEQAETLLALAQGAPLRALALTREIEQRRLFFKAWQNLSFHKEMPLIVAEKWSKFSTEMLIEWMASWVIDLIKLSFVANAEMLNNRDLSEGLHAIAARLKPAGLFEFLDGLYLSKKTLAGQGNKQLVLEGLLIQWSAMQGHT